MRSTALAIFLSALASACQQLPEDESKSTGSGSSAHGDCPGAGEHCDCDDPRAPLGYIRCEDDEPVCECTDCPAYDPESTNGFVACASDVAGTWRLVDARDRGVEFDVWFASGPEPVSCGADASSLDARRGITLQLLEDGSATLIASEDYEAVYRFGDCGFACDWVEMISLSPFDTSDDPSSGPCDTVACGLCECSVDIAHETTAELTWEVEADGALGISGTAAGEFDYCASGDELELSARGIVYRFDRIDVPGTPLSCEERISSRCHLGGGCSWWGMCSGTRLDCEDAPTPLDCVDRPGCAWASGCAGEPNSECPVIPAHVPGCEE